MIMRVVNGDHVITYHLLHLKNTIDDTFQFQSKTFKMPLSKILFWMLVGSSCCALLAVLFSVRSNGDPAFRLESSAEVILSPMNTSVHPCEDFYAFACGLYAQNVNEKSDPLETAHYMMLKNISNFLEMNSSSSDPVILHKARTLYRSCLLNSSVSTAHQNQSSKSVIHVLEQVGLSVIPPLDGVSENFSYVFTMAHANVIFNANFFMRPVIRPVNSTHVCLSLTKPTNYDKPYFSSISEHHISSFLTDRTNTESHEDFLEHARYIMIMMYRIANETVPDLTSSKFNSTIKELYFFDKFMKHMQTIMLKSDFEIREKGTPKVVSALDLPRMYMMDDLCLVSNKFNWTMYIATIMEAVAPGMRMCDSIFIFDPTYLSNILNSILCFSNLQKIELYMWWIMVTKLVPYSTIHWEDQDRNLWCANEVNNILPHATALMLINRSYMLQAEMEIGNMTNKIRNVFNSTITNATWMSQAHKDKISKRLMNMKICIGYPLWLTDYEKVDEFYEKYNQVNLVEDDFLANILTLGQMRQVDLDKKLPQCSSVGPVAVNCVYVPWRNEIYIQSGFLQFPFYGHIQRALNFGSFGTTIGHELWHGFDDSRMESMNAFEDHNLTKEEYSRQVQCLIDHYSNYRESNTIEDLENKDDLLWEDPDKSSDFSADFDGYADFSADFGEYADFLVQNFWEGEVLPDELRTLDENLSDVYGLKISFDTYKDLSKKYGSEPSPYGLEKYSQDQLFFIAYANRFCSRYSDSSYSRGSADEHSPNSIRVWGALRNSEDFAEAWGCKKGSWMNPNAKKCEIW